MEDSQTVHQKQFIMEGINIMTLEYIGVLVAFIVSLGTGTLTIIKWVKQGINHSIMPQLTEIKKQIGDVADKIEKVEMESCKSYLVHYLAMREKGMDVDTCEVERFFETYERYKSLGGNSYIKHKVEKLEKEGRL